MSDQPAVDIAPDTIFAPATPPGRSALAVIRVSGPRAQAALQDIAGTIPAPRVALLRTLRHPATRRPLDQALVLYFKAPATETGEDIAEFQTHGGRAVVAAVLDALAAIPGCRLAEPGEFARRAFHNGKMDLTAVEGLADLIDAETEAQRAQALTQASGALDRLYGGWRKEMVEAQALVEAAIDFADEGDVATNAVAQARLIAATLTHKIDAHLANAHRGEILRSGFKVVIAGPPNAGKSTLLNALAQRDAAIVSDEPGTTRDVIEVRLDLGGIPVIVSDTAGIREAGGAVEREGIRRTLARAEEADLVIWLRDLTDKAPSVPAEWLRTTATDKILPVDTKADLAVGSQPSTGGRLRISTVTDQGLPELIGEIVTRAREQAGGDEGLAPTTLRHRQHLIATQKAIAAFIDGAESDLELRAEDLRLAASELGRLVGRIDPEEVLGAIFGRFCIGK